MEKLRKKTFFVIRNSMKAKTQRAEEGSTQLGDEQGPFFFYSLCGFKQMRANQTIFSCVHKWRSATCTGTHGSHTQCDDPHQCHLKLFSCHLVVSPSSLSLPHNSSENIFIFQYNAISLQICKIHAPENQISKNQAEQKRDFFLPATTDKKRTIRIFLES